MKNNKLLLLLVLILIPAIFPLFVSGFFETDDGTWMIIRFSAFFQALKDGQFPVRFLPNLNNGYGYPVANFLYPLFMYVGVPIHILGFSFVNTIKIVLGLSLLSSGVFSFLWLSKLFKNYAALTGAVAYTLSPYLLYDVYKRGSVGEVLALAIVPFIFWQLERKSLIWSSVGIAALILSHNIIALLFLPVIFIYSIVKSNSTNLNRRQVYMYTWHFIFGLGISAFFWIPALYDRQYTVFDKTTVSEYSNYFLSNFSLLGILFPVVMTMAIFFVLKPSNLLRFFFILALFFSFLTISASDFIWNIFPFVNFIQFPFRLLSVVVLSVAFLVAFLVNNIDKSKTKFIIPLFFALIFLSAFPFLSSVYRNDYPDSFYYTNQDTTTVKKEYMPKWVNSELISEREPVEIIKGQGDIKTVSNKSNEIKFNINCKEECTVSLKKVYFPGWRASINNKEVKIDYNRSGLIEFDTFKGLSSVVVNFTETKIRLIVDLISLFSIVLLGIISFKFKNA